MAAAFLPLHLPLTPASWASKPRPTARPRPRPRSPTLCATPPNTFEALHAAATAAAVSALNAGLPLIELQFPPVPNMATAALNQLLDANRAYARTLLRAFQGRYPPDRTHLVFPDPGEARLAVNAFGDTPFRVWAIPKKPPAYVSGPAPGVVVVVNPGFNVSEWIDMQNLEADLPIVTVNADLDKVRGGYYPRLFYPGLHKAKQQFLSRFEETYYLKQFSNGGTLLRVFPGRWRLFYASLTAESELLWEGDDRPVFSHVERMLAVRRQKDLLAR